MFAPVLVYTVVEVVMMTVLMILTAAELEWTGLRVHGELLQVHGTGRLDGQPTESAKHWTLSGWTVLSDSYSSLDSHIGVRQTFILLTVHTPRS